jgi:formylglycine-generating enzyme required for sulfatase activity
MTEAKRPLKVFLCHAHADREPVRALYKRLTSDGVDAWFDKEKLLPGQDWELEIRKAVREADVVVVCLSKQFNQAGFRQKEVRLALDTAMEQPEGEIFIIPARLEECDTLESLRRWHWVDLFEDDGYEMLMRAFRTRADKIGATLRIKKFSPITEKPTPQPARKPFVSKDVLDKLLPLLGIAGILLVGGVIIWVGSLAIPQMIAPIPTAKVTQTLRPMMQNTSTSSPIISTKTTRPTSISTKPPTKTQTPIPTHTPIVFNPHPDSSDYIDAFGVAMRLVSAGEFTMGSEAYNNEKPIHQVYIDAFYMDKYEVTNALYKTCVDAGGCTLPQQTRSSTRKSYYGNSEFNDYPVIYVNWSQAVTYCEWRGSSLPTEAQWEKAARSTDERTYPWGEGIDCGKANYSSCQGDTRLVGSYERGKSPYDIYDLTGNVWEWVNDWYDGAYYQNSALSNPMGPSLGQYHVLRGGSYLYGDTRDYVRSAFRFDRSPVEYGGIGFRCARSLP